MRPNIELGFDGECLLFTLCYTGCLASQRLGRAFSALHWKGREADACIPLLLWRWASRLSSSPFFLCESLDKAGSTCWGRKRSICYVKLVFLLVHRRNSQENLGDTQDWAPFTIFLPYLCSLSCSKWQSSDFVPSDKQQHEGGRKCFLSAQIKKV